MSQLLETNQVLLSKEKLITVSHSRFGGQNRLDIRKWFLQKTGERQRLLPTQKGVSLSHDEVLILKEEIERFLR